MTAILTGVQPTQGYSYLNGSAPAGVNAAAPQATTPTGVSDQSSVSNTNPYQGSGYSAVNVNFGVGKGAPKNVETLLHQQGFNNSQIYGKGKSDPNSVLNQFMKANPSIHDPSVIGLGKPLVLPSTHHAAAAPAPNVAAGAGRPTAPSPSPAPPAQANPDLYHTSAADVVREGGQALDTAENTVGNAANALYHTSPADVVNAASNGLHQANDWANTQVNNGEAWAGQQINNGEQWAQQQGTNISNGVSGAYHTVANGVSGAYNTVANGVSSAYNTTSGAISHVASVAYHTSTADVVHATENGLNSAGQTISNGYNSAANWTSQQAHNVTAAAEAVPGQIASGFSKLYHSSLADFFGG